MCSFKLIYFFIFILNLFKISYQISDKRLCYDEKCTVQLSKAKTLLQYYRAEPDILSFDANEDVEVYSKAAGSDTSLWGVKIRGKRGYVNKAHIRENKILKIPTLTVNTDFEQVPSNQIKETTYINPEELKDNLPPEKKDDSVINDRGPDVEIDDDMSIEDEEDEDDGEDQDDDEKDVETPELNNMYLEKDLKDNALKMETSNNSESIDSEHEQKLSDKPVGNINTVQTGQKLQKNHEEEQLFTKEEIKVSDKSVESNGSAPSLSQLKNEQVFTESERTVKIESVETNRTVSNSSMEQKQHKDEQVEVYSESERKDSTISVENNGTKRHTNGQGEVYSESERKDSDKSVENNGTVTNSMTQPKPQQKNEQERVDSQDERKIGDTSVENTLFNSDMNQLTQQKPEQNPASYSENIESTSTPTSIEEIPPPIMDFNEVTPNPVQIEPKDYEVKNHGPPAIELSSTKEDKPDSSVNMETVGQAPSVSSKVGNEVLNMSVEVENSSTSGRYESMPELQLAPDITGNDSKIDATLRESTRENDTDTTKLDDPVIVETTNNTSSSHLGEQSHERKIENEPPSLDRTVFGNLFGSQAVASDSVPESKDTGQDVLETSNTHSNIATSASEDNLPNIEVSKDITSEEKTNSDVGPDPDAMATNFVEDVDENGTDNPNKENVPVVDELSNAAIVSSAEETTGDIVVDTNEVSNDNTGFLASLYSFFQGSTNDLSNNVDHDSPPLSMAEKTLKDDIWAPSESNSESCTRSLKEDSLTDVIFGFNSDFLLYLVTTAISCIIFLFVYLAIDRNRREAPLVARINKLEKDLHVCLKENELLQERVAVEDNKLVAELQRQVESLTDTKNDLTTEVSRLQTEIEAKGHLEAKIESLEKDLENTTEIGMEMGRIISEMLNSTDGSANLKENIDQFQKQLLVQKDTINKLSASLSVKEMENCALHDDLQESKRRLDDLQQRYDNVRDDLSTLQSEMVHQRDAMQKDVQLYRQKYDDTFRRNEQLNSDMQVLKAQMSDLTRQVELKTKEYDTLKQTLGNINSIKGEDAVRSLLDTTSLTAQLEQFKAENERFLVQTRQDQLRIDEYERKYRSIQDDLDKVTRDYEEVDKDKTEANMKLEVLNNYFKKRESELQEEVLKYKSIFDAKEGAATSTSERMKLLQEEIENYKSQNETLKQEIISQEIDLKSQISVLEKKVHENWVTARQTERKLEDSRHEAAQLRNRLTLQNRGGFDDMRAQNRVQSPVDQNGDTTLSPHPSIESPASPPLLYSGRDHITQSPPLPALPPPFLPPPPGAPFMPSPLPGMPHFMPPPPSMFPGDHRPPPLGRMSSPPPPMNSRFSPCPLGFPLYDRNSPSPPYDSEYGTSPPARGYSPFNGRDDRRDYKRPPTSRNKGRSMKGSTMSSGSEHSNDSLDKMNRKQSKIV